MKTPHASIHPHLRSSKLRHPPVAAHHSSLVALALALALGAAAGGCADPVSGSDPEATEVTRAKLIIARPDPTLNLNFGEALAADSQTLIIGDHQVYMLNDQGVLSPKGQVGVYNKTGATWTLLQTLVPDPPPKNSEIQFGQHVALRNNLLVVTASRDGLTGTDLTEGAVYVFTRPGAGQSFTKVAKLTAQTPTSQGRFGGIMATNGTFIAASPGTDAAGSFAQIYSVQGNTVSFLYTLSTPTHVLDMAITNSDVLLLNDGPNVLGYHLTTAQAVPIANAQSLITVSGPQFSASGGSVAVLDTSSGGKVIVGTVDSARVNATTSIDIDPDNTFLRGMTFLEGQHVIVAQNDPSGPSLLKYEPSGANFVLAGNIYPPLGSRVVDGFFGTGLTSTSDFVAVGDGDDKGQVFVLGLEPNGRLDGAVYEQQRLAATDSCGNQCAGQSFLATDYGNQVAISGDVAVATTTEQASSLGFPPSVRNPAAHIYVRQASGLWQHAMTVDLGGKMSRGVAVNNGRVFIGQGDYTNNFGFSSGSVLVYERNASQVWTQTGSLVATDDGSFQSLFIGDTIAVDGDTAFVGSYLSVYVFQRAAATGTWSQSRKLALDPSIGSSQGFTHSIALSADHLVVGAKWDNQLGTRQGSAFIYRRSDFTLEQKLLTPFTGVPLTEYGSAVAADGTTVMVGAQGGAFVDVYTMTGTGSTPWVRSPNPLEAVNGALYKVGSSVSLSGDQVLLGAREDGLTGLKDGAAYLIKRINGIWSPASTHVLIPHSHSNGDSPLFGVSLQLSGSRAIVGAPATDDAGVLDSGAAYIFEGLTDADNDGLLVNEDCNDADSLGLACPMPAANMSFEQVAPLWTADSGTFSYDTTQHSSGPTSLKIGNGVTKLRGPSFSSATLGEVGTTLVVDIFRTTTTSNSVTLFMSAPTFGLNESVIGTVSLAALPTNKWVPVSVPFTAQQRDILLHQNTPVQFLVSFNTGGPGLFVDHLHFSGKFDARSVRPPPIAATLGTTSNGGGSYCVALTLGNSGTIATAGWQAVFNANGTTLSSSWGAGFSGTSGTVTISSNQTWNSSIPAGATAFNPSVGFCGTRPTGNTSLPTVVSATAF